MPNPDSESLAAEDLLTRNLDLESKLNDTIELLHLWKNEAFSYRWLVEAIVTNRYSHAEAKEALRRGTFPKEIEGLGSFARD